MNSNSGGANTKLTNGETSPRKGVESSLGISCLPFLDRLVSNDIVAVGLADSPTPMYSEYWD